MKQKLFILEEYENAFGPKSIEFQDSEEDETEESQNEKNIITSSRR